MKTNTIEIGVELLGKKKTYEFTEAEVKDLTGLADRKTALLALRQAFISAGRPLAQGAFLKRHVKPEGVKLIDWMAGFGEADVLEADFPTPVAVWSEALAKAEKAWNREAGSGASVAKVKAEAKAALIAAAKTMLGYGVDLPVVLQAFPSLSEGDLAPDPSQAAESPQDEPEEPALSDTLSELDDSALS